MPVGRSGPQSRPGPPDWGGVGGWTAAGYSHVRELGAGRAGRVVLAKDDVTQTPVAIKYLRTGAASRDRLAATAGPLSRLEDPNLVQFYEYAESSDGVLAIVIEYVEGISLRRLLTANEGRGVGPTAALSVLSGSLLALAALHEAGLAHGAFKPENVLIAADGTVKVGDMGIGDAPPYQAPEQRQSPAADLYAAATVFVECLSGSQAVPESFRALVAAGLAADPGRRPSSAASFLADIDETATAAYGASWERTGRAGLAEQAATAATMPAPVADDRGSVATESVPYETRGTEPEPDEPDSREPDSRESAAPESAAREPAARRAAEHEHGTYQSGSYEPGAYEPGAYDPGGYGRAPFEPAAAAYERTPFEPGAYEGAAYGPGSYERGLYGPPGAGRDPRARRSRPASRTGLRIAIGAGAAVVLAVGATWYVLSSRGSPDSAAHAQDTSSPSTVERLRPPTRPAELARAISKAVAARRTATFAYRTAGVAAQGMLKFTAGSATAYDMNLTPLASGHPDRRHPVSRVILVGNRAYVARGGWQTYPLTRVKPAGDEGRLYATLALDTRQSSSVFNILALLRSTTRVRQSGLTYRGVAAVSRLIRERTVADPYARLPRGAVVSYTLEMAQNLLPRQLIVTIKAPGGRPRAYRTTYTGWGHGPPIVPPR